MSWIEGIGDEVTVGVLIVFGVFILFFAWLSTGIRDIPFISVIVVQLTRRREAQAENNDSTNAETAAPVDTTEESPDRRETTPVESDASAEAAAGSSSQENPTGAIRKTEASIQSENSTTDKATSSESEGTENIEVEKSCSPCQNSSQESDRVNKNKENSVSNTEVKSDETSVSANSPDFEPDICPVSNTELRQRRLEFFSGQSSGNVTTVTDNQSEDKNTESDRINKDSEPSSVSKTKSLSELASDILSSTEQTGTDSVNDTNEQNEQARTQSETGSGSQDSGLEPGLIRVRIKFLNDTQRLVTAFATETIGNFRQRHFSTELSQSKLVRFIFNGRDLRNDSSTLQSYNICDNSVLHCLVTQQPQEPHPDHHGDEDGLDIGMFMFPLFGLLLGIVWYMRFMYRQFFNVTSTLTLGGITFLYLAAFLSSLRGQRNHEHID